ncbi:unnamed protein product [Arctogadus glacialis]
MEEGFSIYRTHVISTPSRPPLSPRPVGHGSPAIDFRMVLKGTNRSRAPAPRVKRERNEQQRKRAKTAVGT